MATEGTRARLRATGWDEPLVLEHLDAELPAPEGDRVLVAVEACGVCHRDLLDREGRFPFLRLPVTPGHEAVGRVLAVGPRVAAWRPGDRVGTLHRDACGTCGACTSGQPSLCPSAAHVFGLLADGGYADHLLAPERALYALPDDLPAAEAAVLHCTFGTAWRDLVVLGRLRAGERVLITGANGGVGAAAVQIAARQGAGAVIAQVRDARHADWLRALGATAVAVDDGSGLHAHADVGRVDLVLDTVGLPTFPSALRSLVPGGRAVVVGNVTPGKMGLNLGLLITFGLTITGGSGATPDDMAALLALHCERPFHVPIDRELPLAEADRAQRLVKAGGLRGRVVLRP